MKQTLLFIYALFFIGKGFATTGGPREVKAIGYNDSAVYFTQSYFDESGRGPQLWIYNFSTGKVTTDDKWTHPEEYQDIEIYVKEIRAAYSIKKMKKEFDEYSINKEDIKIAELESIQKFDKYNEEYYDIYPFVVQYNNQTIVLETCNAGSPNIIHNFTINDRHFAILRYTGLCYEMGYKKDTLFAFTEALALDTLLSIDSNTIEMDSIQISDSTAINHEETQEETYWKRGNPNFLFILFPIGMVLLAVVVLKWKKKKD